MSEDRSARARLAIVEATAALVAEGGLAGFSMDEVARRAGVGKATIYRHWRSRGELLVDVCSTLGEPIPLPDTGDVRRDVVVALTALQRKLTSPTVGPVIAALIEGAEHDSELRRLREATSRQRRQVLEVLLRRGVERGELAPDVDTAVLAELLVAPLFYRRFVSRGRLDRHLVDAVVATVLPMREPSVI